MSTQLQLVSTFRCGNRSTGYPAWSCFSLSTAAAAANDDDAPYIMFTDALSSA